MDRFDAILQQLHRDDHPICPHCGAEIDMTEPERYQNHVTYWGDDDAVDLPCPKCGVTVYLKERVSRSWTPGRTAEEARDS